MSDHKLAEAQAAIHTARLVAEKHRGAGMLEIEHYLSRAAAALAANEQQAGEAVARLLHWHGPSHYPVPHGGIAARTFAEYPKEDANKPDSYWKNGALLYTHPQQPLTREQVKALMTECGYDQASQQERADFINGLRHAEMALGIGITKDTK